MNSKNTFQLEVVDEKAMIAFGKRLAGLVATGSTLYLRGELGAGKTTFCRGFLSGFGHEGYAKSPTYTLVEPYDFPDVSIYHFDLYRLSDPSELEYIGWRDYFHPEAICLVEWPERGGDVLPGPDLDIEIQAAGQGRQVICFARNAKASSVIKSL